jgi:HlyD family secretion protein
MKRAIPIVIGIVIVGAFAWTLLFLYNKSQAKPVVYKTEKPFVTDIVKKTVATGAIVPRQEVEIKPRVSGVIEKLYVEPGEYVERGALVAKIQIIPDMVALSRAESAVESARINFKNAERELNRSEDLYERSVISQAEYDKARLEQQLRKQELDSSEDNLQLIKRGASSRSGKVSNQVRSTVEGMVLEVPVKEGESVIESNTFNAGTTVAFVADMNDMIFEGKVDESEVGKITEGMELAIRIGALDNQSFKGKLEYISPKGAEEEGAIQFEIRASLERRKDVFIRANYSANADIVLDRRDDALAIHESVLQFDKDGKQKFVEVETSPQVFEKRPVKVGLSDGINIEVVSGVTKDDAIKVPETYK